VGVKISALGGFDNNKIKRKRQSYVPPNDIRRNNNSHLIAASPSTSLMGGNGLLRSPNMMSPMMSPQGTSFNQFSGRNVGGTVGNSRPSMSQLLNEEFNKGTRRPDIGGQPGNIANQTTES
jgi:hypothetical protein